jgi:hypothetical protein
VVVAARPSPGTRTPMYSFRRVADRLCVGYTFSPGCTSVKAPAGSRSCARGVKRSSLRRVSGAPEPPVDARDRGAVIRSTPPTTSLGDARRMRPDGSHGGSQNPRGRPSGCDVSEMTTSQEFSRRECEMLKSQMRGKWEILSEQTVRGSKDGFAIYPGFHWPIRLYGGTVTGSQEPPLVFYLRPGHAVGATTERATGTSASEGSRRADSLGIVGSAFRIASAPETRGSRV